MESKQIIHDLTIALIAKSDNCDTPETIVNAYNELLPKVKEVYNDSVKGSRKARIISKSDIFS